MSLPLFEGPEKKLEIILSSEGESLRQASNVFWEEVLRLCGASIVKKSSYKDFDSYVLSESSLFVYERRITLITCGQTQLYQVVPALLDYVGEKNISYLFYGRKSLSFPSEQESDFEQEIAELDRRLEGRSYRMGAANQDHVHVYIGKGRCAEIDSGDFTLELLMMDPCQDQLSHFVDLNESDCSKEMRSASGLDQLYEDMNPQYDDHFFVPCGYSLNGQMGDSYFTVHVTPQEQGAYMSFETNYFEDHWERRIETLLERFKPQKAILVIYHVESMSDIKLDLKVMVQEEYSRISVWDYDVQMLRMACRY